MHAKVIPPEQVMVRMSRSSDAVIDDPRGALQQLRRWSSQAHVNDCGTTRVTIPLDLLRAGGPGRTRWRCNAGTDTGHRYWFQTKFMSLDVIQPNALCPGV